MVLVKFIGTSAAVPSLERGFACIGVLRGKDTILMDCGDGAIHKIMKNGIDVLSVSNILITHYHSDHLSGLTSIIETMGIKRRESDVNLYGPPGLKDYFAMVEKTTNVAFNRKFKINITELRSNQAFLLGDYSVSTFEMDHTLPCLGFRLEVDGAAISYTGDTMPCPGALELAKDADLLIHEATFLSKDAGKAKETKHSVPKEAAETARLARAKKLVMTHVNEKYEMPDEMLDESSRVFANVSVAYDGLSVDVGSG